MHMHVHVHVACTCASSKPRRQERHVLLQPLVVGAFTLLVIRMSPRDRVVFVVRLHALHRVDAGELVIDHVADESAACRKQAPVYACLRMYDHTLHAHAHAQLHVRVCLL